MYLSLDEIRSLMLQKPIIVYSPNGAKDEYYNIKGHTFEKSYFGDGSGLAIASFLKQ